MTTDTRNLEALGPKRLAELLIEINRGKPVPRRLLRLELAAAEWTADLAREVRQRLATIRRSRAILDSHKRHDLVDDLAIHRKAIVGGIAGEDAVEALDLMWQFMALANPILDRCWDGDEIVAGAFNTDDLGAIASASSRDARRLPRIFCIMASRADLHTAAQLQPALCRRCIALEGRIGHMLSPSGDPLSNLAGTPVSGPAIPAQVTRPA